MYYYYFFCVCVCNFTTLPKKLKVKYVNRSEKNEFIQITMCGEGKINNNTKNDSNNV